MTEPNPPVVPTEPMPLQPGLGASSEPAVRPELATRGIDTKGRSLREFAARGMMINTGFSIGMSVLQLVRGFLLASFLTASDYGVWGLLAVSLGTILWLKQVGIGDKFILQEEEDQELAFQKAFTLEALMTGIFMVIIGIALPIFAAVYDEPKIILPGVVAMMVLPAGVMQASQWIYARRMDFVRSRVLTSVDPVVGFVVAMVLATSGAGYWAIAGGVLAGAWTSALITTAVSPYKLRFRYDKGTLKEYYSFSWPLFLSNGASMIQAQSAVLVAQVVLGLPAVGAMSLSASISSFVQRVDGLVTGTLYPAIVAVRSRTDLLFESFVKSNRLALMWAIPFGSGIALFIGDLVHFGLGEKWHGATELLQITGFNAALGHVAYNWDAYMRASNRTRPLAVSGMASMVTFVVFGLPLLALFGLRGLAIGITLQTIANVIVRVHYLRQLFPGFRYWPHARRAILPGIPAILVVVIARLIETGERTIYEAIGEMVVFLALTAAATWFAERELLREAVGYVLRRRAARAAAA
jgi:O-antigen/teichoic acid export membrane protein